MISDLPTELRNLIVKFMSQRDLYRAVLVNRDFNSCFSRSLWVAPEITSQSAFEKFLNMLTVCQHARKVRELNLAYLTRRVRETFVDDAVITLIVNSCPHLSALRVPGCTRLTDASLYTIADTWKLQDIDLSHIGPNLSEDALMSVFSANPQLILVDLYRCPDVVSDRLVEHLASWCGNLRSLDLSLCTRITDIGLAAIAKNCVNLKSVCFNCCRGITDDGIVGVLEACTQLTTIGLRRLPSITDKPILAIAKHCPKLKVLDISESMLVTKNAVKEVGKGCPKVQALDLSFSIPLVYASNELLSHFPALATLNRLPVQHYHASGPSQITKVIYTVSTTPAIVNPVVAPVTRASVTTDCDTSTIIKAAALCVELNQYRIQNMSTTASSSSPNTSTHDSGSEDEETGRSSPKLQADVLDDLESEARTISPSPNSSSVSSTPVIRSASENRDRFVRESEEALNAGGDVSQIGFASAGRGVVRNLRGAMGLGRTSLPCHKGSESLVSSPLSQEDTQSAESAMPTGHDENAGVKKDMSAVSARTDEPQNVETLRDGEGTVGEAKGEQMEEQQHPVQRQPDSNSVEEHTCIADEGSSRSALPKRVESTMSTPAPPSSDGQVPNSTAFDSIPPSTPFRSEDAVRAGPRPAEIQPPSIDIPSETHIGERPTPTTLPLLAVLPTPGCDSPHLNTRSRNRRRSSMTATTQCLYETQTQHELPTAPSSALSSSVIPTPITRRRTGADSLNFAGAPEAHVVSRTRSRKRDKAMESVTGESAMLPQPRPASRRRSSSTTHRNKANGTASMPRKKTANHAHRKRARSPATSSEVYIWPTLSAPLLVLTSATPRTSGSQPAKKLPSNRRSTRPSISIPPPLDSDTDCFASAAATQFRQHHRKRRRATHYTRTTSTAAPASCSSASSTTRRRHVDDSTTAQAMALQEYLRSDRSDAAPICERRTKTAQQAAVWPLFAASFSSTWIWESVAAPHDRGDGDGLAGAAASAVGAVRKRKKKVGTERVRFGGVEELGVSTRLRSAAMKRGGSAGIRDVGEEEHDGDDDEDGYEVGDGVRGDANVGPGAPAKNTRLKRARTEQRMVAELDRERRDGRRRRIDDDRTPEHAATGVMVTRSQKRIGLEEGAEVRSRRRPQQEVRCGGGAGDSDDQVAPTDTEYPSPKFETLRRSIRRRAEGKVVGH